MTAKLDLFAAAPALMKDYQRTSMALDAASGIEPKLSELVKLRASQINGCANCINLHATEARENGETEQRGEIVATRYARTCARIARTASSFAVASDKPGCAGLVIRRR